MSRTPSGPTEPDDAAGPDGTVDRVAARAHELWQARGRDLGYDIKDWFVAEYENLTVLCSHCFREVEAQVATALETTHRALATLGTLVVIAKHLARVVIAGVRSWVRRLALIHGMDSGSAILRRIDRRHAPAVLAAGGKCALHVPRI